MTGIRVRLSRKKKMLETVSDLARGTESASSRALNGHQRLVDRVVAVDSENRTTFEYIR